MSLLNGLVFHYKLDEFTFGTRSDSYGPNTLTPTTGTTGASSGGKIGVAANFVRTNADQLSVASNPQLQFGDRDFTITCWVRNINKGGSQSIVSKYLTTPGGSAEVLLYYSNGNDRINFLVYTGGSNTAHTLLANTYGSMPLNTWFWIRAWYDSTLQQTGISINNGTADTLSIGASLQAPKGADFRIGGNQANPIASWYGQIDEVSRWNRLLTGDEASYIYNSGSGITFEEYLNYNPSKAVHYSHAA